MTVARRKETQSNVIRYLKTGREVGKGEESALLTKLPFSQGLWPSMIELSSLVGGGWLREGDRGGGTMVDIGAEVCCQNMFSIACPKMKWFTRILHAFFARKLLFEKFWGAACRPPPPPPCMPMVVDAWGWGGGGGWCHTPHCYRQLFKYCNM